LPLAHQGLLSRTEEGSFFLHDSKNKRAPFMRSSKIEKASEAIQLQRLKKTSRGGQALNIKSSGKLPSTVAASLFISIEDIKIAGRSPLPLT
jgi:hypothetical protein